MKLRYYFLGLSFLLTVIACTTVSETGKKALILMSPSEEMQLGFSAFEELKKKTPISTDPQANAALQRVGNRISQAVDMQGAQWEFILFEDNSPNAFALPGGKVGFHTGILPITQNEEGMAVVMSHEIAHVVLRHGAQRMSEGLVAEMGRNALGLALNDNEYRTRELANTAYGMGSQLFVILPHSRNHELEADKIGLRFLKRAGYNPEAAVAFWKRFANFNASSGAGKPPEFLSTHPADARRIAQIEEIVRSGQY